jgi:hypothetical protein
MAWFQIPPLLCLGVDCACAFSDCIRLLSSLRHMPSYDFISHFFVNLVADWHFVVPLSPQLERSRPSDCESGTRARPYYFNGPMARPLLYKKTRVIIIASFLCVHLVVYSTRRVVRVISIDAVRSTATSWLSQIHNVRTYSVSSKYQYMAQFVCMLQPAKLLRTSDSGMSS